MNGNDTYSKTKSTVKHLIIFFGGLDILLICIYSAIGLLDRRAGKRNIENENHEHLPENNSAYENVELVSIYPTRIN